jgi:hypothetical protein
MGKKVTRKTYVSKGVHSNVAASTIKAAARGVPLIDRALNKLKAWREGKNPWITIPGPSKNMPFIKVRANSYYGNPKNISYGIYKGKTEE